MEKKKKMIFFYTSIFCPRCMMARRSLFALKKSFPSIEIEEIDITRHPLRAWRDGIRLIPALRSEETVLAGFLLDRRQIENFLSRL
ncbi:MAG: hypothetical protein SCH71_04180 [Desulfobulbaceae bacterium]|nr:hypothetical protein [Desulfobulbaceae bacterium]